MRKVAAMAEVHSLAPAPHKAAGPVGVAASVQVMATVPDFPVCKGGHSLGEGLFTEPLRLRDGFVELPRGPGLGGGIDEEALEAARDDGHRRRSMWRHAEDGSYADS